MPSAPHPLSGCACAELVRWSRVSGAECFPLPPSVVVARKPRPEPGGGSDSSSSIFGLPGRSSQEPCKRLHQAARLMLH